MKKIPVTYFQRRPRPGFNFSMESIFADVRRRLADRIDARVLISSYFNDGIATKFKNILEAGRRAEAGIKHITGEVHFLNLLMTGGQTVVTIHDCRFMNRKAGKKLESLLMKWIYLSGPVARAGHVTTVSEATKRDIIRYTGCRPEKISVIPVAISESFTPQPRPFNRQRPHLLQIGTGDNKNLKRVTDAIAGLGYRLTIVGKLSDEQRAHLEKRGIDYHNIHNVSQEEIVVAYTACDLLVYVSTFEGFGMPIIEANTVGRPVLTSSISSMPEVAGDAALLVDPYSTDAIRAGILRLVQDERLRERLIAKGHENARRFSAAAIADAYYAVYRKLSN